MAADRKRNATRIRRKYSIRKRISGTKLVLALSVFRSSKHIYAQVIDDTTGETLVSASTQSPEIREELAASRRWSEHLLLVSSSLKRPC